MTNGSLMKVKSTAEYSSFCSTFDLHEAIIRLENQFSDDDDDDELEFNDASTLLGH